jgi:hypothetical protein
MTDQSQKAGTDSRQYQAGRDINIGVTAEEVISITRAEVSRSVDQLTAAAKEIAEARNRALGDRIIGAFEGRPELFQAFADPDFQFSLRDAARAAASTDEVYTEELLVDLLTNRAEKGASTRVRLATSQAIKAADKLSLEALNGLTALWATGSLVPSSEAFAEQMTSATKTAEVLVRLGLPTDSGWVGDADVLNLVRVHHGTLVNRAPYKTLLERKMAVNMVIGIDMEVSSPLVATATSSMPELSSQLAPHPLKSGFLRLGGSDKDELLGRLPDHAAESAELQQLIEANGYGSTDQAAMTKLEESVATIPALTTLAKWWDSTPSLDFTLVGDVVSFVNARRHLAFQGAGTVGELLQLRSQQ